MPWPSSRVPTSGFRLLEELAATRREARAEQLSEQRREDSARRLLVAQAEQLKTERREVAAVKAEAALWHSHVRVGSGPEAPAQGGGREQGNHPQRLDAYLASSPS